MNAHMLAWIPCLKYAQEQLKDTIKAGDLKVLFHEARVIRSKFHEARVNGSKEPSSGIDEPVPLMNLVQLLLKYAPSNQATSGMFLSRVS